MADFYTSLQNTANALLTDKGQALVFTRLSSDYDPIEGIEVNKTSQVQTLQGVQLPATKSKLAQFDNGRVEGLTLSKVRFIMASGKGATFTPQSGDLVTIEGKNFSIIGCTPLRPDGATDLSFNIAARETARATT